MRKKGEERRIYKKVGVPDNEGEIDRRNPWSLAGHSTKYKLYSAATEKGGNDRGSHGYCTPVIKLRS